ncbi:MAG TPA: D-TA family PLP-dependent enzyme, partial [Patescibacteria group bacterium]|nr:D-TA family PLP-dependent enzyme [Patescibacteria group bacterium]
MIPAAQRPNWFEVAGVEELSSPCLLLYRARVEENIRRMLGIAGAAERLRPHIKTHKIRELVALQRGLGITKFKCATIAEAEMAANAGASDLLLAYQPVGPAVRRMAALMQAYPGVNFSVLADDPSSITELSRAIQVVGDKRALAARRVIE